MTSKCFLKKKGLRTPLLMRVRQMRGFGQRERESGGKVQQILRGGVNRMVGGHCV